MKRCYEIGKSSVPYSVIPLLHQLRLYYLIRIKKDLTYFSVLYFLCVRLELYFLCVRLELYFLYVRLQLDGGGTAGMQASRPNSNHLELVLIPEIITKNRNYYTITYVYLNKNLFLFTKYQFPSQLEQHQELPEVPTLPK